jgi:hypothetical protein
VVHLLVVEDDETIRRSLARGLADQGATVSVVGSAVDAIKARSTDRPDAVMMDIGSGPRRRLPRTTGGGRRIGGLGDQLIWFALPLLALSLALVWLDRRHRAAVGAGPTCRLHNDRHRPG